MAAVPFSANLHAVCDLRNRRVATRITARHEAATTIVSYGLHDSADFCHCTLTRALVGIESDEMHVCFADRVTAVAVCLHVLGSQLHDAHTHEQITVSLVLLPSVQGPRQTRQSQLTIIPPGRAEEARSLGTASAYSTRLR